MLIVELLILLIVLAWVFGAFYMNDFSVPTRVLSQDQQRILVVFPHADDEALNAGGLLSRLAQNNEVAWVILTRGEKGTPQGTLDENLKTIRLNEARRVASIFHIGQPMQKDYPDGGVESYKAELTAELRGILQAYKPQMVITYDLAGMYGHSDHIVTSEVVTDLVTGDPTIKLWYISYPKRLIDAMTLPEHMAKDPAFKERRVYPTSKVWVGVPGIVKKVKALYAYKSQRDSYRKSFPIKFIPMWVYVSLAFFEYYHEVL